MSGARSGLRFVQVLLLSSCLLLQGCFTAMVWGLEYDGDGFVEASHRPVVEGQKPGNMPSTWQKVLLTPLSLIADIITSPVQILIFVDFDDDDC